MHITTLLIISQLKLQTVLKIKQFPTVYLNKEKSPLFRYMDTDKSVRRSLD